jgi:SAM-dependent methyltransferase
MTSFLEPSRPPRLRDYWVRLALRRVHYTDRVRNLDALYMVEDPWRMGSAKEQARFAWTNRLIAAHLSPLDTILEIGCGEGHQSQYLSPLCNRLYGIDVSPRAVRRARRRCPAGSFEVGDPFTFGSPNAQPLDLVVACEMLYYVKDIPRFLQRIACLGRACLVTYYEGHAKTLDPHFATLNCRRENFHFDDTSWTAVWWHSQYYAD